MTEMAALVMIMLAIFAIACFQSEKEKAVMALERQKHRNAILLHTLKSLIEISEKNGIAINQELKDALKKEMP